LPGATDAAPVGVAGEGRVVVPALERALTGMLTPALICNVVSSRSAVTLLGGSVPNQPSEGSLGRLRCNLRRSSGGGIREEASFVERGRREARRANESTMPCATEQWFMRASQERRTEDYSPTSHSSEPTSTQLVPPFSPPNRCNCSSSSLASAPLFRSNSS
jgi:hypothetical protein